MSTHKTCSICAVEKLLDDFPDNKLGKYGKQGRCRPCDRAYVNAWGKTEAGKAKARRIRLRGVYGITPEDYDAMLASQNGVCAICERNDPRGQRLAIDHDHVTGAVRGLLCRACNTALGLLDDDIVRLARMRRYLRRSSN